MKSSFYRNNRIFIILGILGIIMAALEAVVVIYLRQLFYPVGFDFSLAQASQQIITIEWFREAATIVMLVTIAIIAAKDFPGWMIFFFFLLGTWSIFYYIWLYLLTGWPESLLTWDLLFVIPVPWAAPVLAPVICSLIMIFISVSMLNLRIKGYKAYFGLREWAFIIIGMAAILFSYMKDYSCIFLKENSISGMDSLIKSPHFWETLNKFRPEHFGWYSFATGEILILTGFVLAFKYGRRGKQMAPGQNH